MLLIVGAFLAIGGTVDIAILIALLVLGVRFNEPIVAAGDLGGGVAVAKTTIDRLDELAAVPDCPSPSIRRRLPTSASSSRVSPSATAATPCCEICPSPPQPEG